MALNTKFPLQAKYTGPNSGMFGFCHHDKLFEWSDDIGERCYFVEREKLSNEMGIRRSHLIYIDPIECPAAYARKPLDDQHDAACKQIADQYLAACRPLADKYFAACRPLADKYLAARKPLADKYDAARKPLADKYFAACRPLIDKYDAARRQLDVEVLNYLKTQIPDCRWDEARRELRF